MLFWTPEKARFWFEHPRTNLFFVFLLWFSFKNNRRTNVLCVSIVFKAKTKEKCEEKNLFRIFSKLKGACLGVNQLKKTNYVLAFKTIEVKIGAHRNFGFGLLKSYMTFGYLTCSDRSKNMSTLHHIVMYRYSSMPVLMFSHFMYTLLSELGMLPFFNVTSGDNATMFKSLCDTLKSEKCRTLGSQNGVLTPYSTRQATMFRPWNKVRMLLVPSSCIRANTGRLYDHYRLIFFYRGT